MTNHPVAMTMRIHHLPITRRFRPVIAVLLLLGNPLLAQEPVPTERLLNSDPQKLLELSQGTRSSITMTSIADLENRDVREAPANVQVITARPEDYSRAIGNAPTALRAIR